MLLDAPYAMCGTALADMGVPARAHREQIFDKAVALLLCQPCPRNHLRFPSSLLFLLLRLQVHQLDPAPPLRHPLLCPRASHVSTLPHVSAMSSVLSVLSVSACVMSACVSTLVSTVGTRLSALRMLALPPYVAPSPHLSALPSNTSAPPP
eukprot:735651-Rhodomonas_salina.1